MLEASAEVTLNLPQPLINHSFPSEDQAQTGSH